MPAIDDFKEADIGYIYRVSGPCKYYLLNIINIYLFK